MTREESIKVLEILMTETWISSKEKEALHYAINNMELDKGFQLGRFACQQGCQQGRFAVTHFCQQGRFSVTHF